MIRALQHSHRRPLSVPLNALVKLADRPRNISIICDAIFGTLHGRFGPFRSLNFTRTTFPSVNLLRTRYSYSSNKFNGPFLVSFTNLWKVWYAYKSSQEQRYVHLHRKYGDIVRIGSKVLSFANPQAIHDIYGPKGTPQKAQWPRYV
jgi:hypothetical protein